MELTAPKISKILQYFIKSVMIFAIVKPVLTFCLITSIKLLTNVYLIVLNLACIQNRSIILVLLTVLLEEQKVEAFVSIMNSVPHHVQLVNRKVVMILALPAQFQNL